MEVIPKLFEERQHNLEVYAQKKIYHDIVLLNKLPIVQNETGEFTNMVSSDETDVVGDLVGTEDFADFSELKFGEPSQYRGATRPLGYMFRMNTRLNDIGKLEARLAVFLNKSVAKMARFYDKLFTSELIAGAGAAAPQNLNTIDSNSTGYDVIENELKIIDAMEFKNDLSTGFTATDVFAPRADVMAIKLALSKDNLLDDSQLNYIPVTGDYLGSGEKLVMDINNPTATIEKYANPRYSIISRMEQEAGLNVTNELELPTSFINLKVTEPETPNQTNYYIFAEANVNILEPNSIMHIQ